MACGHAPVTIEEKTLDEAEDNDTHMHPNMEINEWKLLSILIPLPI
jgi:hypothetical protein